MEKQNAGIADVAIIGMAGRFPGAPDVATFWQNICGGIESLTTYSDAELLCAGVSEEDLNNPAYVKVGSIIEGADLFDAEYFGYSATEAEFIDPQQRLFLETAVHALESAACDPFSYQGSIAVYAGAALNVYQYLFLDKLLNRLRSSSTLRSIFTQSNDKDFLTTRVSYKLNLSGPSVAVQTACSTSLLAVHMACQAILSGECDIALAGGVSITNSYSKAGYDYVQGGIFSPSGRTYPFDARSRGTIFGDGVGVVVLKRLDCAIADRDPIRAIIRGSAANNDGAGKVGYTAPSADAQAAVITEALAIAGVPPETVGYIEAHGTGTEIGDPIEVSALKQVFHERAGRNNPCTLGSVKANIGHLNTASGVAGLIKAALMLENACFPPSINFETPNPNMAPLNGDLTINTSLRKWEQDAGSRRAAVSAFGIGGTNVHVVLEEAKARLVEQSRRSCHLLLLSARSTEALNNVASNLRRFLIDNPCEIGDVAFTLAAGRRSHIHRRCIVCRDSADAVAALEGLDNTRVATGVVAQGTEKPVTFLFPGQGSDYPSMGRGLYGAETAFREQIDECSAILEDLGLCCFRETLFNSVRDTAALDTSFAQPATFVISYAVAKLWMSLGVSPSAVVGHSVGEYVAACIAGIFSLKDALSVIVARGKIVSALPKGAMLSIPMPSNRIDAVVGKSVNIAADNAPGLCAISGPINEIEDIQRGFASRGIYTVRLNTSHAFHSPMMLPALGALMEVLGRVKLSAPNIPIVSSVTGDWMTASQAQDPAYWGSQLLERVRFSDCVNLISAKLPGVMLEVGPGKTLRTLTRLNPSAGQMQIYSSIPGPDDEPDEAASIVRVTGQLWAAGTSIKPSELYRSERRAKISLPTYPFERRRYWLPDGLARVDPAVGRVPNAPIADGAILTLEWRGGAMPASPVRPRTTTDGIGLAFIGSDDLSDGLLAELSSRCARVISVIASDRFERISADSFLLDPGIQEHFDQLFRELFSEKDSIRLIVYAWTVLSLDSRRDASTKAVDKCYHGVAEVLRFAGEARLSHQIRFCLIAAGTQDVTGNESVRPIAALALGPVLAAIVEYDLASTHYVDVALCDTVGGRSRSLVSNIVDQLQDGTLPPVVAFRGASRWRPCAQVSKLDQRRSKYLAPTGTYLITGGMGDLGLEVAHALSTCGEPIRLVLLSRRNPLSTHSSAVDAAFEARSAKVRSVVQDIRERGGQVILAEADVSDFDAMKRAVHEACSQFGPISCVIHAAGLAGIGLLGSKTRAEAESVLASKVAGTLTIERLFRNAPLDLLVLFSSLSSVVPGAGRADYAAGNAFLDAFARQGTTSARRTVSINWDTWGEMGMAVRTLRPHQANGASSYWSTALRTSDAIESFHRVLASDLAQALVSRRQMGELDNLTIHDAARKRQTMLTGLASADGVAGSQHPRPNVTTPFEAPKSELERILASIWGEVLSIDTVGINDDFFELGGHSLMALQLVSRLRAHFEIELSPRDVLGSATIKGLVGIIENMLIADIERSVPRTVVN